MTTTTRPGSVPDRAARPLTSLRANCLAAAVLLIIQFGLGIGVNLYVTLPAHKSFLSTVSGSAVLTAHAVVALGLLGAAIGTLVRAIRARRVVAFTSVGLAAIVTAAAAGVSFASHQSNGDSLGMALATATAMFCYLAAVFRLN